MLRLVELLLGYMLEPTSGKKCWLLAAKKAIKV